MDNLNNEVQESGSKKTLTILVWIVIIAIIIVAITVVVLKQRGSVGPQNVETSLEEIEDENLRALEALRRQSEETGGNDMTEEESLAALEALRQQSENN